MLKGKTAVVTGGSRGIGRAIVMKYATAGANVAVIYAGNAESAEEVCRAAEELGVKALAYRCDVSDFTETKKAVDGIIRDFGGIDILVNNAGITKDSLIFFMKEADFDAVIEVNLKGTFNMIKHCYGHFIRKKAGRIINISSIVGLTGNAGQANYAASKAGLVGLTKSVAKELAGRGVCCNAIAPGFIRTDMTEEIDIQGFPIPMGYAGSPEDVAELALFLAGSGARYITGEVIRVDGGLAI